MKIVNNMGAGMHPLNHASALVKMASDVMFSLAVNDADSAVSRLDTLTKIIGQLHQSIAAAPDARLPPIG